MKEYTYHFNDLNHSAQWLLAQAPKGVVCLSAPMGTGKTTLVKAMIAQLGAVDSGSSPSFGLVHPYVNAQNDTVAYHMDLYRLKNASELWEIGWEEYAESGVWIFVEWPELAIEIMDHPYTLAKISQNPDQSRTLTLEYVQP